MNLIVRANEFTVEKELIDREIDRNIHGKLDVYLKKFTTPDSETQIEVTITRDMKKEEKPKATASGKVIVHINGKTFRAEREGFEKLEDLINHLFTHIKTQMGK